ncbi:MAG: hypothetical protein LBH33_00055 [Endomicrobium sp.]|jgi:hypothetical protein|nr:hypothetical protein [Endomicrobium sp.]
MKKKLFPFLLIFVSSTILAQETLASASSINSSWEEKVSQIVERLSDDKIEFVQRWAVGYDANDRSLALRRWFSEKDGIDIGFSVQNFNPSLNEKFIHDILDEVVPESVSIIDKLDASLKGSFWIAKLNYNRIVRDYGKIKIFANACFKFGHVDAYAKFKMKYYSGEDKNNTPSVPTNKDSTITDINLDVDISEWMFGGGLGLGIEYFIFKTLSLTGECGFHLLYVGKDEIGGTFYGTGTYNSGWWPKVGIRVYF